MADLLHELILERAWSRPGDDALAYRDRALDYGTLAEAVARCAEGLVGLGVAAGERVAVYLEKRVETVVAIFGAAHAGAVFVPVNPLLKAPQVAHILRDCDVRVLVTSRDRLRALDQALPACPALRAVVLADAAGAEPGLAGGVRRLPWDALAQGDAGARLHRRIDADVAAILYTSGSTGKPKGVVLSHRNVVAGAESVARYLGNTAEDRILAVLPLSFDAGFSQMTTAFRAGACVVMHNYLLPQDVPRAAARHAITGIGAVPPLWIPLAAQPWPEACTDTLRYLTNTGGAMPRRTLDALRAALPRTRVFLMYGLTEAFRSTYLPPEEIDRRPDSIGKAIPNAEILVVRPDGTRCDPGEPGELVHRGALVALGYWNDPDRTAERFRPAPGQPEGLPVPELAVWSGDTVRADEEGYLYFIGRGDEMIKSSGYRVSPTEVEEALYESALVAEAAVFGVAHPELGQAIVAAVVPASAGFDEETLAAHCRERLPAFMVPRRFDLHEALPRSPNGKIDRRLLAEESASLSA